MKEIAKNVARLFTTTVPVQRRKPDGSFEHVEIDGGGNETITGRTEQPVHPITGKPVEVFKPYPVKLLKGFSKGRKGSVSYVEFTPGWSLYIFNTDHETVHTDDPKEGVDFEFLDPADFEWKYGKFNPIKKGKKNGKGTSS
jgi:hypothetical protein